MQLVEVNPEKQSKKRLRRSRNEKLAILKEADIPGANIAAVARKYGVSASLLFTWRRQLQKNGQSEFGTGDDVDSVAEYQKMLNVISQRESLLELPARKIADEATTDKITAYNLSCSVSNLVTATGKLQERKLDLIEKLAAAQDVERAATGDDEYDPNNVDLAIERTAERVCYELVKRAVEQRRAEAVACAAQGSSHV